MLIKRAFNKDYINKTHTNNKTFFSFQKNVKKQRQKIKLALLFFLLVITSALLFLFFTGKKIKQDKEPVIIEPSKTPHKISYNHKVEESYMSKSLYTTFNKADDNISEITLHENNETATLTEILKKEITTLWKEKKTDYAPAYFQLDSKLPSGSNPDKQYSEQIVVKNVLSKNEGYKLDDKKKEYKVRINLCSSMQQVEVLKAQVISRNPIMFTRHKFIVEQVLNDGEVLYYLSLGPYKKYGSANAVVQQMKKIGHQCFIYK